MLNFIKFTNSKWYKEERIKKDLAMIGQHQLGHSQVCWCTQKDKHKLREEFVLLEGSVVYLMTIGL